MKKLMLSIAALILLNNCLIAQTCVWQTSTTGGAWLSSGNWSPAVPATSSVSQFNVNPTSTGQVGINMNGSTNNGTNNQAVGAIFLNSTRATPTIIGNSSTTSNGTLTLNGATVTPPSGSAVNNVIIANYASTPATNTLTIQNNTAGGNKTMGVALGLSNGVILSGAGTSTTVGNVTNISSIISGSGAITFLGGGTYDATSASGNNGGVLKLTGVNTATGGITVGSSSSTYNSGILDLGVTNALSNTSGNNITINPNSQLYLSASAGTFTTGNQTLTLNGAGNGISTTYGAGALRTAANAYTWTGPVALPSDATIFAGAGLILTGSVTGTGQMTKAGTGTLTLTTATGTNTWSGGTKIKTGAITVSSGSFLSSGDLIFSQAGSGVSTTVTFANAAQSIANLSSSFDATYTVTATQTLSLTAGTLTVTPTANCTFGDGATTTQKSVITGAGGIVKTGSFRLTLTSAANTFTGGLTINGGEVRLNPSTTPLTLGSCPLVLNGGTLSTNSISGTSPICSLKTLSLTENSTIDLGTSVAHTIRFVNGAGSFTAGKTLNITNWGTGSKGRIFVGASSSALSAAQLAQITFTGTGGATVTAAILPTGEIVPAPPVITSLSASTGIPGSSITITGKNFNSTAVSNIVYFGAVKATVTGGSSTSLTVTVPAGALAGPVTVMNPAFNLIGYQVGYFTPVFTNTYFNNATLNFNAVVNVTATAGSGSSPYSGAIGDVDGDGKPDLIVNNLNNSTVSILLNTSTSGTITSGSFTQYGSELSLAGKPNNVKLADIDGDGKLDIVVALTNNNNIEVLRNTTTGTGAPTFATRADFAAGTVSAVPVVADFDGDGKPDIAVSLPGGSVGILRNSSVSGSISFVSMAYLTVGSVPSGVCFADMDGDGLTDIATVNSGFTGTAYTGNTASVLRNTSVAGAISFATAITLTTGSGPIDIAAGDIDGDGKAELVVTNFNDATFSVFRNTSISGTISYAAKTDFSTGTGTAFSGSTGTWPTGICIADLNGDGKLDVVVANSNESTLSMFRNTATSGTIAASSFATKQDFGTGANPVTVTIGDLDADGYPEVVAGNSGSNTVSVLKNYPLVAITPITGPTSVCVGSTASLSSTTIGGTWSVAYSNASINSSGTVSGLSAGSNVVTYTVTAGGNTNFVTYNITVNSMSWSGGTSTDWNNATNWSCGFVPGATNDVTISSGTTFAPSISATADGTTKDLTIASGVTLTIASTYKLNVKGNLTNNGTVAGAGTLTMNGTSAQNVIGNGQIANFDVDNTSGVTVSSGGSVKLTVTNLLSITSGTLATGNNVVLYSDVNGSARVGQLTGTPITGNVTVNQYMASGRRAYRFWAHPFTSYIALNQLTDNIDISGSGGSTNGFTTTATNAPSAYWYNPLVGNSSLLSDPGWTSFTDANATATANRLNQYQGIRVYYRGAKGEGLGFGSYTPSATVIDQAGVLNQGNQDIPMQRGSSSNQDYNMIGNPYASPVDIGTVIYNEAQLGHINGAYFYIWNPFIGTAGGFRGYAYSTCSCSTGGTVVPYYLQANDAFQVRTTGTGYSLHFTEANKGANITSAYSLMKTSPDVTALRIYDGNYHFYDELNVRFDAKATENEDAQFDGGKPEGASFNFYSLSADNHKLLADVRPYRAGSNIQLGIGTSYAQDFILRAENVAGPTEGKIYLHDKLLQQYVLLQAGTEYHFTVNADAKTQGENRFELSLDPSGVADLATTKGLNVTMVPNPATTEVKIAFNQEKAEKVTVNVSGLSGAQVYETTTAALQNGNITVPLGKFASGVYLVTISSGDEKITRRLIKE